MFGIDLDMSDLQEEADKVRSSKEAELNESIRQEPKIAAYMEEIRRRFAGLHFEEPITLTPILESELGEIMRQAGENS